VNARIPGVTGERYGALVAEHLALDDRAFEAAAAEVRRVDAETYEEVRAAGGDPYRIRYNDFMAVRAGAGAED
jgi:hypothetical protein